MTKTLLEITQDNKSKLSKQLTINKVQEQLTIKDTIPEVKKVLRQDHFYYFIKIILAFELHR